MNNYFIKEKTGNICVVLKMLREAVDQESEKAHHKKLRILVTVSNQLVVYRVNFKKSY